MVVCALQETSPSLGCCLRVRVVFRALSSAFVSEYLKDGSHLLLALVRSLLSLSSPWVKCSFSLLSRLCLHFSEISLWHVLVCTALGLFCWFTQLLESLSVSLPNQRNFNHDYFNHYPALPTPPQPAISSPSRTLMTQMSENLL